MYQKRQNVMLCQPLDDKNLKRLFRDSGWVVSQPKLDGDRCWNSGSTLISSNANIFYGVPHIQKAIEHLTEIIKKALEEKEYYISFDGELYKHGYSHEQIHGIVSRTKELHKDFLSIQYHIFDIKDTKATQIERIDKLLFIKDLWEKHAIEEYKDILQFVPSHVCAIEEDVWDKYAHYNSQGYEGIIIRHPHAFYIDRSPAARPWFVLKYKPKRSDTYDFVSFEEAISSTGEPLGRVGAITCKDQEGNEFKVGAGLGVDNAELQHMWENREYYNQDMKVLVEYQNLTSMGGVPRFGKFRGVLK